MRTSSPHKIYSQTACYIRLWINHYGKTLIKVYTAGRIHCSQTNPYPPWTVPGLIMLLWLVIIRCCTVTGIDHGHLRTAGTNHVFISYLQPTGKVRSVFMIDSKGFLWTGIAKLSVTSTKGQPHPWFSSVSVASEQERGRKAIEASCAVCFNTLGIKTCLFTLAWCRFTCKCYIVQ